MKYGLKLSLLLSERPKLPTILASLCAIGLTHITKKRKKIVEFANSVDGDEAAHNELPYLDPCC